MTLEVCILAAGKGTRNKFFGGRLHKALLPVGNRAVLSRIIDQFPSGTRFVIAAGHLAGQITDYLVLAHPGLDCAVVPIDNVDGKGSGPGYSLWSCRTALSGPFVLTSCDTLVGGTIPPLERSWMGVSKVEDPEKWCTVSVEGSRIRQLHYKSPLGPRLAFVGIAGIHDAAAFWGGLDAGRGGDGEFQVNAGFEALLRSGVDAVEMPWNDTGTDENYLKTLNAYEKNYTFTGKTTDVTYRLGGTVMKFFPEHELAESRFKRGEAHRDTFAPVIDHRGGFFSYRFIEGPLLSAGLDGASCTRMLSWLERAFWRRQPADPAAFAALCRRFYRDKTLGRLEAFLAAFQPEGEEAESLINGLTCPSVRALIGRIDEGFWAGFLPSTFHGDLHADNVIVTGDGFRLIDWRQDFGGSLELGDRYYDLAKFFHTLDLSVETMESGDYQAEAAGGGLRLSHADTPELAQARDAFWAFAAAQGYDRRRIEIVNALIFVNMAPLYERRMALYLYNLGRYRLAQALGPCSERRT